MAFTPKDFTPTEHLLLELLAARRRLGHATWSVQARNNASLARLEEKKLVNFKSAPVEGYSLAWLTDQGVAFMFSHKYEAPIGGKKFKKHQKDLRKQARAVKEKKLS
jgi:hypothetical protein